MNDLFGEPIDGRRQYTPHELERIWEVGQDAKAKGIGLIPAFKSLARELGRSSAKSLEARYYAIRKEKGIPTPGERRPYTEEDDKMIAEEVERAKENDVDLDVVWAALGERLERTPSGVQAHYYTQIVKTKSERGEPDAIMSSTEASAILNRLKGLAKEKAKLQNKAKEKIEDVRTERDQARRERDEYKRMYEKLLKELDQLRDYLDA